MFDTVRLALKNPLKNNDFRVRSRSSPFVLNRVQPAILLVSVGTVTVTSDIANEGHRRHMPRKKDGEPANPEHIRADVDCRAARPKFDNGA
jgi:hypothetical protein